MKISAQTFSKMNTSVFAIVIAMLMSLPGIANAAILEEIIVTAQKREQNMQEIAIAITAFTGEQMDSLGWEDNLSIGSFTPGLISTSNTGDNGNIALFSIRGSAQSDFAEGQEAPVANYIDGVYISSPGASGFPLFDSERVEVLKGPQGTLYGRNSTGGLIHFISNKPTDEFEASFDATYGSYSQVRFTGVVSGPMTDNIQGRLAFYSNNHDGYMKNHIGEIDTRGLHTRAPSPSFSALRPAGAPVNTGQLDNAEDKREGDTQAARLHINWDITADSSLLVQGRFVTIDEAGGIWDNRATKTDPVTGLGVFCKPFDLDCGPGGGIGNGPFSDPDLFQWSLFDVPNGQIDDGIGDKWDGAYNRPESGVIRETWGVTGTYKHAFENFNLTSITDYTDSDKSYNEDDDATFGDFVNYDVGADIEQFSQELRLDGKTDKMDWVVGAYYLHIDNKFFGEFPLQYQFEYFPRFDGDLETESWAVFSQVEYRLTDTISVTGGIRYTSDEKDFRYELTECDLTSRNQNGDGFCTAATIVDPVVAANNPIGSLAPFIVDNPVPLFFNLGMGKVSGTAKLDWHPNDDMLFYASFSRGIKAGGFNTPLDGFDTPDSLPYKPEILDAYEIGAKLTLFDGLARLNAAIFHYDYKDFTAFYFAGTTSAMISSQGDFNGGEVELYLTPGNGVDIVAGVAFNDTELNTSPDVTIPLLNQKASLAPELTFNVMGRKEWNMGTDHRMALQVQANYVDSYFANPLNSEVFKVGDYWLVDARLSYYSANDKWQASVYVKNMFNDDSDLYSYDISGFGNYSIFLTNPPRWLGANFKYKWN